VGRDSYRGTPHPSDHLRAKAGRSPVRDSPRTVRGRGAHCCSEPSRPSVTSRRPSLCLSPLTSTPRQPLHRAPLLPGRLCWSPCPLEESKAMGRPLLLPLLLLPVFLQTGLLGSALPKLERGSGERLPQDLEPAEGGPVCVFLPRNQPHHHPGCQDHHLEAQQHNHHSQPRSHRGQRALRVLAPKSGDYCVGGSGCRCTWNHDFGTDLPPLVEEKK
uniref:Uncharacterized protein n=1 Tax=Aotus nancymaae TaxID=37293 RepID=A0A2K5DNJ5_AOTNA